MNQDQERVEADKICKSMWALTSKRGSVMHLVIINLIANYLAGFQNADTRAEIGCEIMNFINQFVDVPSFTEIN